MRVFKGLFYANAICLMLTFIAIVGCDPSVIPNNSGKGKFVSADISGRANSGEGADMRLFAEDVQPVSAQMNEAGNSNQQQQIAREIEEADIVKHIGTKIYLLNDARGFRIIDVSDWSNPRLQGDFAFIGEPVEMYVENNVACIVVRNYSTCRLDENAQPVKISASVILMIDISDADNPVLIDSFNIEGYVNETRRVGDVIYLAGYKTDWFGPYLANGKSEFQYNGFVVSVYVADPDNVRLVDEKELIGKGEYIHARQDAIFVAGYDWSSEQTTIQYVDISDPNGSIVLKDTVNVPGRILNRFCLDAYSDYLRVITQKDRWWVAEDDIESQDELQDKEVSFSDEDSDMPGVNMFVFDIKNPDDINLVSKLHIIDDEDLKAVRFDGEKGYVITYFQIDPLWVIDLKNPLKPAISGHLEIPGYSTYLYPQGNRLIAVGIDDTRAWRASVMLYDVSDASNPTELDRVILGTEYSNSEANYDEKAMEVLPEEKLIFVPFDTYRYSDNRNWLAMIDYSSDKLTKLAEIAHRGTAIRCGTDIEADVLWILSQQAFGTLDISDRNSPKQLATIGLAENIVAWNVLGEYGLRLVAMNNRYSGITFQLQTVRSDNPNTQDVVSSVDIEGGYNTKLIIANSSLALLITSMPNGNTRIYSIDISELPKISLIGNKEFEFSLINDWPCWPVYATEMPGVYPGFVPPVPPWSNQQENPIILDNNVLALITHSSDWFVNEGDNVELKLIPLDEPANLEISKSVELYSQDFNQIVKVASSGSKVFCTLGRPIEENIISAIIGIDTNDDKPLVSYYMKIIDCSNPEEPIESEPINIPGLAIYLKDNIVLTIDPRWDADSLSWQFCSVLIDTDNATAELLDEISLSENPPFIMKFSGNLAIMAISNVDYQLDRPVILQTETRFAKESGNEQDACFSELGSFKLIAIDFGNPERLQITSNTKYAGQCELQALVGNKLVGQIDSTMQAIIWRITSENQLKLYKVIDLLEYITDVSASNESIDFACGRAGILRLKYDD